MTRLFKREARLVVGDLDVTGLKFGFNVDLHTRKEPNTAKITVYNLSEANRRSLEGLRRGDIPVKLEAGYEGETFLIFLGRLDSADSMKEGPNWVTTVFMEDGRAARTARGGVPFKAGASFKKALTDVVNEMGVGLGNLVEQVGASLNIPGLGSSTKFGMASRGDAQDMLERILNSSGLTHSVQGGSLQVRRKGQPIHPLSAATVLSKSSGLIGYPAVDPKGRLTARALLVNGLGPGHAVKIQSIGAEGIWLIDSVAYSGDTHGSDWYADIEGPRLA